MKGGATTAEVGTSHTQGESTRELHSMLTERTGTTRTTEPRITPAMQAAKQIRGEYREMPE